MHWVLSYQLFPAKDVVTGRLCHALITQAMCDTAAAAGAQGLPLCAFPEWHAKDTLTFVVMAHSAIRQAPDQLFCQRQSLCVSKLSAGDFKSLISAYRGQSQSDTAITISGA